jgi:hypothetical protein
MGRVRRSLLRSNDFVSGVRVIVGTGLLGRAKQPRAGFGVQTQSNGSDFGAKICFGKSLYFAEPYGRWQNFRRRVAVKSADLA